MFSAEPAEDSRGWNGARAWCSLERDLTVSAKHVEPHVQLTGGCTIHSLTTGDTSKSGLITLPERACVTPPWRCAASWSRIRWDDPR
nr:DUF6228 family protein [Streptomyces pactum]